MRDLRSPIRLLAAFALAAVPAACSFIVESSGTQCQVDEDCARFPGSRCDVAGGVCVPLDGGAEGGGCEGGTDGGC